MKQEKALRRSTTIIHIVALGVGGKMISLKLSRPRDAAVATGQCYGSGSTRTEQQSYVQTLDLRQD